MARISVGAAVGAGFGLIARKPLSVVAWGVPPALVQAVLLGLVGPVYLSLISQMISAGGSGGTSPLLAMQPQLMQLQGVVQLLNLAQLFVSAVVYCAVFRAVLHPERSAFAYLRVGAAEGYLTMLIIGAVFAWVIGLLLVMIPVAIIVAVVAIASHGGGAGLAILLPLIVLVLVVGVLYVGLRFSFVGPMIVQDGKFHLLESWELTRGQVGSLFLIGLCLLGLLILFDIVIVAVLIGAGAGAVAAMGGLAELKTIFTQSPQLVLGKIWPLLAIYGLLMIPITGCGLAIAGAPFARAYKDVALDPSATFA
jgi:hypothetical protein